MSPPVFWLFPIIILPGVALLIMSTAMRYGQIHSELHHLQEVNEPISPMFHSHLVQRAKFFRNALVSLYLSAGALALGSFFGAILDLINQPSDWAVIALSFIGILCLIFATFELIRESRLSYRIIEHHLAKLNVTEGRK